MTILKLLDNIIDSLDKGDYSATIFLDFSKAFDTVKHQILLQKMYHYGIRGIANSIFESYLSDRSQYCTFGGVKSSTKNISCGVPQGSILGPLLFLININDLGPIFKNFSTVLFADDSNLIVNGKSLESIERKINDDIPLLTSWLQTNRLSLNL
jgi:ribonuclease P/MRP protein subunit RPP40